MTGVDDERVAREMAGLIQEQEDGRQGQAEPGMLDHGQEILNRDRLSAHLLAELDQLRRTGSQDDTFPAYAIAFWLAVAFLCVGLQSLTVGGHPVLGGFLLVVGTVLMLHRDGLGDQLMLRRQDRRERRLQRILAIPGVLETVTVRGVDDLRARTFAVIAADERSRIVAMDAWQDPALDSEGARLDVDDELARITRRAALIADKRAEIGGRDERMLERPEAKPLRDIHAVLDQALDALGTRVAALVRYRLTLADFDAQQKLLETLDRAQGVDLSELVSQNADDGVAGQRLDQLSAEVRDAQLAVTAGIESLARQAAELAEP